MSLIWPEPLSLYSYLYHIIITELNILHDVENQAMTSDCKNSKSRRASEAFQWLKSENPFFILAMQPHGLYGCNSEISAMRQVIKHKSSSYATSYYGGHVKTNPLHVDSEMYQQTLPLNTKKKFIKQVFQSGSLDYYKLTCISAESLLMIIYFDIKES